MNTGTRSELADGYQLHWYKFGRVLGQGGFGITYAGYDANLDQSVAIKEYFPRNKAIRDQAGQVHPHNDDDFIYDWGLTRFIQEAQTLARFRHPNIVRVLSVFEANGTAYIVMDLELGKGILDANIPDEDTLLGIIHSLLDGLDHVHKAGVIHRDIKPDNIIIRNGYSPVLIDFGSARIAVSDDTQQLTSLVTRGYAPIEQYGGTGKGPSKQGPWTDIYSLGAVMYEVIKGESPPDAMERATAVLDGENDPFESSQIFKSTKYSQLLKGAIDAALGLNAADRPSSISALRNLLPESKQDFTNGVSSKVNTNKPEPEAEKLHTTAHENGLKKPKPEPVMPEKDLSKLSILLVDDEVFVLNITKRVLNKMGINNIETAPNGEEALRFLDNADELPQLIICDLNMPGMDGVALLRHLGQRHVKLGVILVSGEDKRILQTAETLGKSHNLYILGSIQKPIKPEPLVKLLNEFDSNLTEVPFRRIDPITEKELLENISGDAIELVFQPKVSVKEKKLNGVEALARWRHPDRGLLGPGAFIPLAEELGQIDILTENVLRKAMAQGGEWQAEGFNIGISVNYSVDSLHRMDLPEYIESVAEEQGINPRLVTIEVTESRLMQDITSSVEILTRLRMKGLGLSIDDFGTGHSSMEQLNRVPFTELKIDRAFVNGAAEDQAVRAMLKSSVTLGKELDLNIVAEGVETQEDWDVVEAAGCDEVQGFFVARPMPGDDILPWKEKWES